MTDTHSTLERIENELGALAESLPGALAQQAEEARHRVMYLLACDA